VDTNPFQTPETGFVATLAPPLAGLPRVDGNCLVVASGTVLPPFCVKTNRPVSEGDLVRKQFDWCPPWVAILIIVNLLILIVVYFLVRKRCLLTFGLDPRVRKGYRRRMLLKIAAAILLFLAIPVVSALEANGSPIATIIVLVLFLVAVVSIFIGNSPLSVAKHQKGMFWIKGFSKDFLQRFDQAPPPLASNNNSA
jgi:hypothetical protein